MYLLFLLKGILQILQGCKKFPQLDSAIQSLMLIAQVTRNGELPSQAAQNNCLCDVNKDHSLPMIALHPLRDGSDCTRAEDMQILFICEICKMCTEIFFGILIAPQSVWGWI